MGLFGMAGRAQKRKEKLKKRIDAQEQEQRQEQEDDIYEQYGKKNKKKNKKSFKESEQQDAIEELQKHQPGMKQLQQQPKKKNAGGLGKPGMNPKRQDGHEGHKKQQPASAAPAGKNPMGKPLPTAHVDPPTKQQTQQVQQKSIEVKAAQSRKGKKRGFKEDGDDLLAKYREKLQGSTFRLLNEELYRSPNSFVSQTLRDQATYNDYHEGYRVQMGQWPVTPTQLIIDALVQDKRGRFLQNKDKHIPGHVRNQKWVIADMGCGDCAIAKTLVTQHGAAVGHGVDQNSKQENAFTIHSFDLCAGTEYATAADMANVPLQNNSVDCAIFCLSLMATDYDRYIKEAHRILRQGKLLKIVEVRSRLPNPKHFADLVETLGFKCDWYDVAANYFVAFDFIKLSPEQMEQQEKEQGAASAQETKGFKRGNKYGNQTSASVQNMQLQEILAPCVYKRR